MTSESTPRTSSLVIACLGLIFALAAQSAAATPIQIYFEGSLQRIPTPFYPQPPFLPGAPVSGMVEFETEGAIDRIPGPNGGQYSGIVTQFRVDIGGFTWESSGLDGSNQVLINNGSASPNTESFVARSPVSGPSFDGFTPDNAQFGLSSFPRDFILITDALPTADILRRMFNAPQSVLNTVRFVGPGPDRELQFLAWWVYELRVVPEPGTAVLLMLGLAGLAGTRPR